MRPLHFLLLLNIVFVACLPESEPSNEDSAIQFGVRDSLYSEVLSENREIWVHIPDGQGLEVAETKYPVLYLLDGDGHFYSVAGLIRQLSAINGNTKLPPMIVVAILNTERTRDLTPTPVEGFDNSGGGENFTKFIADELIPYVESKYPVAPYKTLVGHSFGGLFAIHTLVHHQDLFDAYVAIDPSLWWDDRKLLEQSRKVLTSEGALDGKSMFVGVAHTMSRDMDTLRVQLDTSGNFAHIKSILEFSKLAASNPQSKLEFNWKYYPDDSHGSVPLITEYDGLRFLFNWYDFTRDDEIFQPDSVVSAEKAVKIVNEHFEVVSQRLGYDFKPPETFINQGAYGLLGFANEKARAFFELNVKNYPESANVYDSMGDYYLAQGDTINAIVNFEKAMEISEADHTRTKLETLK